MPNAKARHDQRSTLGRGLKGNHRPGTSDSPWSIAQPCGGSFVVALAVVYA